MVGVLLSGEGRWGLDHFKHFFVQDFAMLACFVLCA